MVLQSQWSPVELNVFNCLQDLRNSSVLCSFSYWWSGFHHVRVGNLVFHMFVCRLSGVPWEGRLIFWIDDYVRSLTSPRWVVRCLFVPQGCSFPCTWFFQGLLEKASLARETSARFIHHFCGEKFLESDHVPRFRIFSATAPKDKRSFSSPSTLRR